jgi:hypothetical protein
MTYADEFYRVEKHNRGHFIVVRVRRQATGYSRLTLAHYWRRSVAEEIAESLNRWAEEEVLIDVPGDAKLDPYEKKTEGLRRERSARVPEEQFA